MSQQKVPLNLLESLASSSVRSAQKVKAKAIIVLAKSGNTSRLIAKYRPDCPVFCVCVPNEKYEAENVAGKEPHPEVYTPKFARKSGWVNRDIRKIYQNLRLHTRGIR